METELANLLDQHKHIAYDLDGTIFGMYSNILVEYIKNNPTKDHSILTSRQSALIPQSNQSLIQLFGTIFLLNILYIPLPLN